MCTGPIWCQTNGILWGLLNRCYGRCVSHTVFSHPPRSRLNDCGCVCVAERVCFKWPSPASSVPGTPSLRILSVCRVEKPSLCVFFCCCCCCCCCFYLFIYFLPLLRRPRSCGERGLHGPEGAPIHSEPGPLQPSHLHDLLVRCGESHQGQ